MPDPLLVVTSVAASGRWDARDVHGRGTLVLHLEEALLEHGSAGELVLEYHELTDATWERETLTLYRAADVIALQGPRELSRAWGLVVEQACALPEVTRGLRTLGTARGGPSGLQARFFGPLLAARRRLEVADAMERRAGQFDADAIAARLNAAIGEFAAERHPFDAPRRRAMEAHLEEAIEPLLGRLEVLAAAATAVAGAASGARFTAWRGWTRQLRQVFLEADRAWGHMIRHLEPR